MSGGLEEFEGKGLHFKIAVAVEVKKEFFQYRAEWDKDGNKHYVGGRELLLARLDAWSGRAVTTVDTKLERGGRRQTFFSTLYGRCLRDAVAGTLKVP